MKIGRLSPRNVILMQSELARPPLSPSPLYPKGWPRVAIYRGNPCHFISKLAIVILLAFSTVRGE
eukprot:5904816-Pleurochrysis_carterae.AAC.2